MIKNKKQSGIITTELVIGIVLTIFVLFIVLGLFSNNLRNIVANSKLRNIFNNNDVKTAYSFFDKNYADSQINVQIMGEQGLQMLRKRANNMALNLIESPFNSSNTNGTTIKYLSSAIQIIVGNGNICIYMKKDSDKLCSDSSIGGYSYNISSSGSSALTIDKVDLTGGNILATVILPLGNAIISPSPDGSDTPLTSSLTVEQKYSELQKLTEAYKPYISSNAALVKMLNIFKSAVISTPANDLIEDLNNLITSLKNSSEMAYQKCEDGEDEGEDCSPFISDGDNERLQGRLNDFRNNLSGAVTENPNITISEIVEIVNNRIGERVIELSDFDDVNNPTTCQVLVNGLINIANNHDLSTTNFNIQSTSSGYKIQRGEYKCNNWR